MSAMAILMKPSDYSERTIEIEGWLIRLSTYRLEQVWHSKADNVSPGAWLARTTGATREEAEAKGIERATELLQRTSRRAV